MTVDEAISLWLGNESVPGIGRPVGPGWASIRLSLVKHLYAVVGAEEVGELGPAHIYRVQNYCAARGYSNAYANQITHGVLLGLLRDLEDLAMIGPEVRPRVKRAKKLRDTAETKEKHYSREERDRILEAFAGHWASPHVHFLFLTGCRIGELCGLRQRDIDWRSRVVSIQRSRGRFGLTACKTRRSQRTLSMPDDLVAALEPLREEDHPDAFFFPGKHSELLNADGFRKNTWTRVLRENGLKRLTVHSTRHSWATCALESGIHIAEVAAQLGDTVAMTQSRYGHVKPRFDPNTAIGRPTPDPSIPNVIEVVRERRSAERPYLRLVK